MKWLPTSEECVQKINKGLENPILNKGWLQLFEFCMNSKLNL